MKCADRNILHQFYTSKRGFSFVVTDTWVTRHKTDKFQWGKKGRKQEKYEGLGRAEQVGVKRVIILKELLKMLNFFLEPSFSEKYTIKTIF